jgi:hypothetical protein
MPNYNKWCSVMFLFNFLVKASEFVPILSQQYLQLTLNDVASAIQLILDFYREMSGPQIYARVVFFLPHSNDSYKLHVKFIHFPTIFTISFLFLYDFLIIPILKTIFRSKFGWVLLENGPNPNSNNAPPSSAPNSVPLAKTFTVLQLPENHQ